MASAPLTPSVTQAYSAPSLNRERSIDEVNLKTLLTRFRSTVASTQKLNRDFESKLEGLREYYEKKDAERGFTIELLKRKLKILDQCVKFVLSLYATVSLLDLVISLLRSESSLFKYISKNLNHVKHLAIALAGMGFLFSGNLIELG